MKGKREQDKSGHKVFTPADTYGPVPAKHRICMGCKRPLKLSLFYGIRYCPICAPVSNRKNVPFKRRLLMAPVWGGVITFAPFLFLYLFIAVASGSLPFPFPISPLLLGLMAFFWVWASIMCFAVGSGGSSGGVWGDGGGGNGGG